MTECRAPFLLHANMKFIISSTQLGIERTFEREAFSEDSIRRLKKFSEVANKLNTSTLVTGWGSTKISLHFSNSGTVSNTGSIPSDELIEAFLHRLRPIYLNNSETEFGAIANLVSAHLKDRAISECIRHWKKHYTLKESQEVFTIGVNKHIINSESFFGNYVNALEYHQEEDRISKIKEVTDKLPIEAIKPIIVLMLMTKLNAINKLASFINSCLKRDSVTINMD